MESLVTSLELSKKLKELGVEKKSVFYWAEDGLKTEVPSIVIGYHDNEYNWSYYSAFTATELMEMMPEGTEVAKNIGNKYSAFYKKYSCTLCDTPQEALGLLRAHLKENKIV